MKILLLSLSFFVSFCVVAQAQSRIIKGKISDDAGAPLPGVNVVVKNSNTGVITDIDGNYTITVQSGDDLTFSFVGFETKTISVDSQTVVNVVLKEGIQLEEVVVTGLGIEREKREIGYGISQVSGEDLTVSRSSNIVNALQGKTTGLIVNQSGGNVGGSSQVIIRGLTSLSGFNNPLWVVDGVPINNTASITGSRISGNRDFFNGAAIINPDDVESMNIMKGAAATALYGSRAAAGAIIVTTKKADGSSIKGLGRPRISINSTTRFDELFRIPDMQYEYSGGDFGKYDSSTISNAFGAPIRGQLVTEAISNNRDVPLQAYEKNYNDFYELGRTLINNIAVSDAGKKFDYRLSVTSLNQKGILPGALMDRLTISLNAGIKHTKWLTTRASVQYVRSETQGTGVAGSNDTNVISWTRFTPSTNFKLFKPWKNAAGVQINTASEDVNNPFWLRYENLNDRDDDRLITSMTQIIKPIKNLNITSRFGYDYEYDKRLITNAVGTITVATGSFSVDTYKRTQINWDGIIDYTHRFGDVKLKGLVGFNYNERIVEVEGLDASDLSVPGLLNPSNARTTSPYRDYASQQLIGAYFQLDASYKKWLTLTVTGRNDWSSTLPLANNSYFYPSVSAAFVFTDAFNIATRALSFAKLRGSWANVGNTTGPYSLLFRFFPAAVANGQYDLDLTFPYDNRLGFAKTNVIPNANLLPELQISWEIGTELQFLDGRIALDFNYFNSENRNQILNQPIPESTGFGDQTINGGTLITSGFEVTLDAKVLDVGGFVWNTTINASTNKVEVSDLGSNRVLLPGASAFSSVQVVAVNNGTIEIIGLGWERDKTTGRPLINPNTGRRIVDDATKSFGGVFPDATWGFINQMSYKGFSLSVTIDGKIGGKFKSATIENLWDGGFTKETAVNRRGTLIDLEGVIANADGTVRQNDVPVESTANFWENVGADDLAEHAIFDGTFIKLREIGLFYSFPHSIMEKIPLTGLRLGVEARNIALIYSKIPHIDPEANLFGAGSAGFGVERNAIPSTRSIGFNVQMTF